MFALVQCTPWFMLSYSPLDGFIFILLLRYIFNIQGKKGLYKGYNIPDISNTKIIIKKTNRTFPIHKVTIFEKKFFPPLLPTPPPPSFYHTFERTSSMSYIHPP